MAEPPAIVEPPPAVADPPSEPAPAAPVVRDFRAMGAALRTAPDLDLALAGPFSPAPEPITEAQPPAQVKPAGPVPSRPTVRSEEAISTALFAIHELWLRTKNASETRRRLKEILALLGED